jgi:hypothetical protein
MAETLPINIPIPPEPSITTYSFTDVATNTGYLVLYPVMVNENSAETYTLTTSSGVYSNGTLAKQRPFGGTYSASSISINFDMLIVKRMILKGKARVSMALGVTAGSGSAFDMVTTASFYKVVGGTPTQLGSTSTNTHNGSGSSLMNSTSVSHQIDISETELKVGDTLRFTFTINDCGAQIVFHDPANRTVIDADGTSLSPTKSTVELPLRVDL